MILEVIEVPDPRLREKALPVPEEHFDWEELRTLIDNMAETMHSKEGVGLAAPQVGVARRVLVAALPLEEEKSDMGGMELGDHRSYIMELVNPVLSELSDFRRADEMCLSVPQFRAQKLRAYKLKVDALDRNGKSLSFWAFGFCAVVLQHECDHFEGKTILDDLSSKNRKAFLSWLKKQKTDKKPE